MSTFEPTERTRVRRRHERGIYDREVINRIIDEALVGHVAVVIDGLPYVIPTAIVRIDDHVYIHGSVGNRMMTALVAGAPACVSVMIVDSIVAGRSGFACSMDYRSVMIYGEAEKIVDTDEKIRLLDAFIGGIIPGHKVRTPKPNELAATLLLRFPLSEASAKIRKVGNLEVDGDEDLDLWAGIIPVQLTAGSPIRCSDLKAEIETPAYALDFKRLDRL